ncbi:hypothetical protein GCM10011326_34360 [Salipiger profundus]|nr:hypothetical protein GCM10011326_34360 [Salipiger profundus]
MLDLLRPEAHHGDPDMGFALQEPPLEKHREGIADLGPGHAKFSGKLSLSKPLARHVLLTHDPVTQNARELGGRQAGAVDVGGGLVGGCHGPLTSCRQNG